MKIRLHSTQDVRDVSPDVAEMMSAAGLAYILTPVEVNALNMAAKPPHFLNWNLAPQEARRVEDLVGPPIVMWRCQECGQVTYIESFKGTACEPVHHFGKQHAPDEFVAAYKKAFKEWERKGNCLMKGAWQSDLDRANAESNERHRQELKRIKDGEVATL